MTSYTYSNDLTEIKTTLDKILEGMYLNVDKQREIFAHVDESVSRFKSELIELVAERMRKLEEKQAEVVCTCECTCECGRFCKCERITKYVMKKAVEHVTTQCLAMEFISRINVKSL